MEAKFTVVENGIEKKMTYAEMMSRNTDLDDVFEEIDEKIFLEIDRMTNNLKEIRNRVDKRKHIADLWVYQNDKFEALYKILKRYENKLAEIEKSQIDKRLKNF